MLDRVGTLFFPNPKQEDEGKENSPFSSFNLLLPLIPVLCIKFFLRLSCSGLGKQ